MIVAALVVLSCDIIVSVLSGYLIRNVPDVGLNQTNTVQALLYREADVLILGSSRANHSYDSKLFERETHLSCYNAGRDGMNILYDAMILYSYIERKQPQVIIIDIASSMLDASWNDSYKDMKCYFGLTKSLDSIMNVNFSPLDKIKMKSGLYRYNKSWEWLLKSYFTERRDTSDGYRPLKIAAGNEMSYSLKNDMFSPDSGNLLVLERMLHTCSERNIKVIITYTPSLFVCRKGGVEDWLSQFCKSKSLLFYDFGRSRKYYMNPGLFYDYTHLNAEGALLLTEELVSLLSADGVIPCQE
ncbi:MAG: hypothetical protein ACI350_10265 [Prevotella sp.]